MNLKIIESDEALITSVSDGNDIAFEKLVKKYESRVINLIYKYINSPSDAEDLAQEVFFKVWKYARDFKAKSKFSTWLYKIAVNVCLNNKKQKSTLSESTEKKNEFFRDETEPEIVSPISFQPDIITEQNEQNTLIRKAIDELPPAQKMALILSNFEKYSYKEIADIMEISISSVESLLFRAKQNLKKSLLPLREKGEI